jgi:exonuclease SbcC
MRICSILLENINSLVGTWKVDFRTPSYEESGLFAITGPTGAGKSTLLDALCLGLYGRTPRLESISKSSNEAMSRQRGICRAEVVFEVPRGIFRASWGQHRAKKSPEGALQQPWRELANAVTQEILESSITGVNALVEELTGMDFHRFTRSVLLAQGGFASFLKAPPAEKAPLLEQITGTDLYSRFSIYVHQRRKREQETLKEMESKSAAMSLLSPEEVEALQQAYGRVVEEERELELLQKELHRGKEWRSTLERLEREIREAEKDQLLLKERQKNAEGDLRRLRRGQQALTLEAPYANLEHARKEREDLARKIASLQEEQRALEERLEQLRREEEDAATGAEVARKNWEEQRPLLEECCRREEELTALQERQQEIAELIKKKEALRKKHQKERCTLEESCAASEKALEAYARFFEEHHEDASLEEALGTLREKWQQHQEKKGREEALGREKREEEGRLKSVKSDEERLTAELETLRKKNEELEALQAEQRQKLGDLLEGKEVSCWHNSEETCRAAIRWSEAMLQSLEEAEDLQKNLATLQKGMTEQREQRESVAADLGNSEKILFQIGERCAAQEKLLHLSLRVASLEEERSRLAEGSPCPLCGSMEHPYRKYTAPPEESTERQELERIRQEQKREEKSRRAFEKKLAALESRLEGDAREEERLTAALEQVASRIELLKREQPLPLENFPQGPPSEQLRQTLAALQREEASLKERLQSIEALRKTLEKLKEQEEFEKEALLEKEKGLQSLIFTVQKMEAEIARRVKELEDLRKESAVLEQSLRSLLAPYGEIPAEKPLGQGLFNDLEHRKKIWKEQVEQQKEEKLRFRGLEERRESMKNQERLMEEDLQEIRGDEEKRKQILEQKREERLALYKGDPRKGLEELEEIQEKTRREHQRLAAGTMELSGKQEVFEASRKKESELFEKALKSEALRGEAFRKALEKSSFTDEEEFRAARISPELREELTLLQEELEQKEASLKERLCRGAEALKVEQEKKITSLSVEELEKEEAQCAEALREKRQSLGALKAKEEEQATLLKKAEELSCQQEAQKKVLREWEELHALVGSADGSKFQRFVQGLTFEMLVAQANRQLQKMTDRYLLLQDPEKPLEFSVCDSYQGGEIRSSKNLSGGESFLVSLALALGLSRMIGGESRVESLFLDEGFGSLDEETLEVALQALGELQGSCRLVGVISHVGALAERVSNQIRVIPMSGGRSRLEGPGVTLREK